MYRGGGFCVVGQLVSTARLDEFYWHEACVRESMSGWAHHIWFRPIEGTHFSNSRKAQVSYQPLGCMGHGSASFV